VKFKYRHNSSLYSVPYLKRLDRLYGVWVIAFSQDGSSVVVNTDDEEILLKSIEGETIAVLPHDDRVRFARVSRDGRFVLLSSGFSVRCYDTASAKELWRSDMRSDDAGQVLQITPDDRYVIFKSARSSGAIRFVHIETGTERTTINAAPIFTGFALSADGRTLATTLFRGPLAIWSLTE